VQFRPLLREIDPHRQQDDQDDPHDHPYFLCKRHQAHADSPGPIRHAGIPFMFTVFLSYQKCERADVFTKFIPARSASAPKVNYAAQMLIIG
jgi:hypothetical protein